MDDFFFFDAPPPEDWPEQPGEDIPWPDEEYERDEWREPEDDEFVGPPMPDDLRDQGQRLGDIPIDGPGDSTIVIGIVDGDGDGAPDGGTVGVKVPLD